MPKYAKRTQRGQVDRYKKRQLQNHCTCLPDARVLCEERGGTSMGVVSTGQ